MASSTENFDSYNDGDLNGQGSWSGSSYFDIQGTVKQAGTKAVKYVSPLSTTYYAVSKTFSSFTNGVVTIYVRYDTAASGYSVFSLNDGSTNAFYIQFRSPVDSGIRFVGATTIEMGGAMSLATFYKVQMEVRSSDGYGRVSINDGTFSDWIAPANAWSSISVITFNCRGSADSANTSYFDELSIYDRNYYLDASSGTFTLTGVGAGLTKAITLVAGLGEFALTGYDVVFTRAYTLVASAGSFILTGVNASLTKAITLVAGAGSFILTGKDVILRQVLNLIASVGEFTLTGYDVILKRTYILVAETGSFLLTGFSAFLTRGYILVAEAGSFILTGVSATLSKGYNLIAEAGVFSVTAKSVQFLFNGIATYWGNITKPTDATYTSIDKPDDDIWTDITKLN